MGSRITRIPAKGAISAVVAAEVCQRNENFARIRNDAGLETLLGSASGSKQLGEIIFRAANQLQRLLPRNSDARLDGSQRRSAGRIAQRAETRDWRKSHVASNDTTPRRGNVGGECLGAAGHRR